MLGYFNKFGIEDANNLAENYVRLTREAYGTDSKICVRYYAKN